MVRVIGHDKNSFLYVTCRNCAAELEYTPHEVKKEWVSDYGGGRDEYKHIQCPQCGKKVTVK